MRSIEERKIDNIKLKNLIQPIFVRKSNLYLGIPPRTKTSSAISRINLIPMLKIAEFKYFMLKIIHTELYKNMNTVIKNEYNHTKKDSRKLNT
jgi:hypothetical protein